MKIKIKMNRIKINISKNKVKKVFVSFLAAATIFTSVNGVLAEKIIVNVPSTIYERQSATPISSGVTHEHIQRFTTSGWWNINVLRVDLSDPYTDIKGLFNEEGIPKRDRVTSMVEKSNAIAGINGDFFNTSPMSSAMGTLINNGEMISSPIEKAYALPTFFIDFLNNPTIDYVDRSMVAENNKSGQKIIINTINKVTKEFNSVTLLNKHWGQKSIGTRFHKDLIEVVVENDIVKDVRVGMEAVNIPKEGYVLAVRGERNQNLDKFQVGDPVTLNISTTPDINNIKFAIGGGSIVLKDGQLSLTDINAKGNHPRTGIGITKDGKELILVTIDGRDSSFKGVSQEMFGSILRELGAYNGLNLDGGGSTAMAIKPLDEEKANLVNKPSDGSERSVVNSVGIFSNAPKDELSYIKVSADDTKVFMNTSRKFEVKGYDKYHNPVELDSSKLIFSHEGVEGSMEGNTFYPTSSGKATITVKYDDIVGTSEISVLGSVKEINASLSNFTIDINSKKSLPIFYGKDENGYKAKIYPNDIQFNSKENIGYVMDNIFYSGKESAAGILTAKIGDAIKNIKVYIGSNEKFLYGFETMENLRFTSYPDTVIGQVNQSEEAKEGTKSIALNYDFSQGVNTRAAYANFGTEENPGLSIDGIPKKLGLWVKGDGNGTWLRGSILDSKGKSHIIDFDKNLNWTDWQFITANIPSNISYPIKLERVYVAEIDSAKKPSGTILLDGLTGYFPPTLGDTVDSDSSLQDNKNTKSEVKENGFSFSITMDPIGLNDLVGYDAETEIKKKINKNKIGIFLNGISAEFKQGLKTTAIIDASGSYSTNKHRDMYFINVNTEKGGIRSTNAAQWNKLIYDLENRNENNLILFLSSPIFGERGFKDKLEGELLHEYLVKAREKGKNIFVVHGGNSNTSQLKEGVRYIELNTRKLTKPEDIYNLSIIEFVVNGQEATYEISPLFKKP